MHEECMGQDMVHLEAAVVGCIGWCWALEDVPSTLSQEVDFPKHTQIRSGNARSLIQYLLIQRPGLAIFDRPVHTALQHR